MRLPQREIRRAVAKAIRFHANVEQEIWDHIQEYADKIWADMYENVPVDTGNLRSTLEIILKQTTLSALIGTKKTTYAIYVELGTRLASAQPFARPALEKYKQPFIDGLFFIIARANAKT